MVAYSAPVFFFFFSLACFFLYPGKSECQPASIPTAGGLQRMDEREGGRGHGEQEGRREQER